jgi:hypothetical protein
MPRSEEFHTLTSISPRAKGGRERERERGRVRGRVWVRVRVREWASREGVAQDQEQVKEQE